MSSKWFSASLALVALCCTLGASPDAEAFQAWRDRRGLFLGLNLGGGLGSSEGITTEEGCVASSTSLGDGVGMAFRARVGGGVERWLTFDLSGGMWSRGVSNDGSVQTLTSLDLMLGGNFFVLDSGLYLRAAGGMSQLSVERNQGCSQSSLGLVGALGGGFEFFANSQLAVGAGAELQRHAVNPILNVFLVTVGATWY